MPFVKRVNTRKADRLLTELADVGAALTAAHKRRDQLVRQASAAGATRRDVAAAARLTPGRVQQLVNEQE
jgi:hypothetical protein